MNRLQKYFKLLEDKYEDIIFINTYDDGDFIITFRNKVLLDVRIIDNFIYAESPLELDPNTVRSHGIIYKGDFNKLIEDFDKCLNKFLDNLRVIEKYIKLPNLEGTMNLKDGNRVIIKFSDYGFNLKVLVREKFISQDIINHINNIVKILEIYKVEYETL